MNRRWFQSICTAAVVTCCMSALPIQSGQAVVHALSLESNQTYTTGEEQETPLLPKMMNQATGEEFDQSIVHYQPKIYVNDLFGQGKNTKIASSINLFGINNVKDTETPDAYEFKHAYVTSDPDEKGQTVTKEISQVIKLKGQYYALIKGTKQDYVKFSSEKQISVSYNRYLRIGFDRSQSASQYITTAGQSSSDVQIIAGMTMITPVEASEGISEKHEKQGFYVYHSAYADQKLYYIPDFMSVQFARPAFTQVSQKNGTEESNTAMKTTANFYRYVDQNDSQDFYENLNPFSMMARNEHLGKDVIEYDYFVRHSGVVRLEEGIPSNESDQSTQFTLHFPTSNNYGGNTTFFSSTVGYNAQNATKRAMGRVTWAYITGNDAFPYQNKTIDGKNYTNNYPISKGGTVVFTLQPTMNGLESKYKYHTHLNKLVMNGYSINLPISELRAKANDLISQKYSRTAYTYLPSGEVVAVNYVPMPDDMAANVTPWDVDKVGSPYYFVTIFNIQGDISIYGNGEKRADGSTAIANDFVFIQDGLGFEYGSGSSQYVTLSQSGDGLELGRNETYVVSSILQVDHDLDLNSASIWSGKDRSKEFLQREFPFGYFFEGQAKNGFGIAKSRRLIVDTQHPLKFTVDKGSRTNAIKINATDGTYRGRYYDIPNAPTATTSGNAQSGYLAKEEKGKYWIDFKSNSDSENYGATLYRVHVKDKNFKSFQVQFQDSNGQILSEKTLQNLVFPRTNVSLTSSLKIDEFGNVSSLSSSNVGIGQTANGTKVKESDESGFITIPALPEGATFYELVSVSQNGTQIPLTHKKFLPGQKVFTGQFLPEGTDFGQANGIDNGAIVTLKAVKVTPYEPKAETTLAESAVDIHVYDEVNRGLYVGDEVLADHFVTDLGEESPLKEGAYQLYNAQNGLADVSKTGAWSTYRLTRATVGTDKIYTMKNFGDSSYEITSTLATIREKQPSNLTVENQTVVDPLSQDSNGVLPTAAKLAWSTTADATVTLQKEIDWPGVEVGISHPVKETAQVDSVKIPINEWQEKANNDSDSLQIPFTAQATGVDHRKQPLTAIRQQTSTHTVSSPANLLETRLLRNRDLSGASRLSTLANTEDEATAEEPTVANGPKLVTLTVTKAMSPTPTAKGVDGENVVTVTFAKQSETLASFGTDDKSSSYVQVLQGGQQLNVTRTDLVDEGNQYRLSVTLDKPLQKAEQLTVKYRYNARYQSVDAAFTVDASWRDISNTGLKLICSPFVWVLVLTGGAVGVARYRKMKMK